MDVTALRVIALAFGCNLQSQSCSVTDSASSLFFATRRCLLCRGSVCLLFRGCEPCGYADVGSPNPANVNPASPPSFSPSLSRVRAFVLRSALERCCEPQRQNEKTDARLDLGARVVLGCCSRSSRFACAHCLGARRVEPSCNPRLTRSLPNASQSLLSGTVPH